LNPYGFNLIGKYIE